jgi:RAB protein geranylgeranyltransferase component A
LQVSTLVCLVFPSGLFIRWFKCLQHRILGQQRYWITRESIGESTSSGSKLEDWLGKAIQRSLDPNARKEDLANKLAYDKEQMKQAFPYLMAREIPRQISEGFAQNAAMTVLGARSAVDAMNETMRARTPLSFASAPYQVQKYFS